MQESQATEPVEEVLDCALPHTSFFFVYGDGPLPIHGQNAALQRRQKQELNSCCNGGSPNHVEYSSRTAMRRVNLGAPSTSGALLHEFPKRRCK
jgi:hypothetical protein